MGAKAPIIGDNKMIDKIFNAIAYIAIIAAVIILPYACTTKIVNL